jgi:hypothetical protein
MSKRYQRVIRSSRKAKKDRQCNVQKIPKCIVCHSSLYGYFWLPFGIFWPLYCLSFFALRLFLITLWYLLDVALSVILRFTATSDYPLVSFGHCIVCHSSVYGYFWLPFGIFWPLYCLSFFDLRLLLRRRTDNTMAKRYQRVIRSSRKAKNDRQYNGQKIPKGNQK